MNGLFSGTSDPVCSVNIRASKRKVSDEKHIKDFKVKGGFTEDYIFSRSDKVNSQGRKNHWKYQCPCCSFDIYTLEGLCTGIFESTGQSLKLGRKSCRCSDKYPWTKEQREFYIKTLCKEEGLTFTGWFSDDTHLWEGCQSKFKWVCKSGHERVSTVNGFINSGKRCRLCTYSYSTGLGYYPSRENEVDSLYVLVLGEGRKAFCKVGRTFYKTSRNGYNRINNIKKDTHLQVTQIMSAHGLHKEIYKLEQDVLQYSERYVHYTKFTGSGELFHYTDLRKVCNFIESWCEDSKGRSFKYIYKEDF